MANKIEPNKYSKNANIKADTPFKNIVAFIGVLLMLSGMLGLVIELFSHNDWLNNAWFIAQFHLILADPFRLIYVGIGIFGLYLLGKFFTPQGENKNSGKGNMLMYIMIAIGLYYLVRLGLTGMIGAVDVTKLFNKI